MSNVGVTASTPAPTTAPHAPLTLGRPSQPANTCASKLGLATITAVPFTCASVTGAVRPSALPQSCTADTASVVSSREGGCRSTFFESGLTRKLAGGGADRADRGAVAGRLGHRRLRRKDGAPQSGPANGVHLISHSPDFSQPSSLPISLRPSHSPDFSQPSSLLISLRPSYSPVSSQPSSCPAG